MTCILRNMATLMALVGCFLSFDFKMSDTMEKNVVAYSYFENQVLSLESIA